MLALTIRGELWRIESVTRDPARCTQIAIASSFVAITRNAAGRFYAMTSSGAVAEDGRASNDCRTWRDFGLLRSSCEFVALSSGGSPERLVALSACGEVFLSGTGSSSWEYCTQIPDSVDRFVALSGTPGGGFNALTAYGHVWQQSNGQSWTLAGELPSERAPYVAIVGSDPAWVLSATGDLAIRDPDTGRWILCGRIPPSPDEGFVALGQDGGGNSFALTTGGAVWQVGPASSDCHLWRPYAELPRPSPDKGNDSQTRARLVIGPNPMRGRSTIQVSLPVSGFTRLELHDAAGRVIRTLLAEERASGISRVVWDGSLESGRPAPPGVYFLRLRCGDFEAVEQVQVIR